MGKIIFDPIHGYIELNDICVSIIDTEEFQRLRDIKQLGACYFVYPGASHNRFEHSIGVCHLAGELIENLKRKQPELNISDNLINIIKVAGLCHDLGHGPYSHTFDNEFIPRINVNMVHHEERSCMMLRYIVEKYSINLSEIELDTICELINPIRKDIKPRYIYNIVSNIDNGIDVDKFDYIKRDVYNVGLSYSFDYDRILTQARVIDDHICYPYKSAHSVYQLFMIRYTLHLDVYHHPVVKCIEYMISDFMKLSEKYLSLSEKIDNPIEFYKITDSIINTVYNLETNDENIIKAKNIIRDIKHRNIYKYIGEVIAKKDDSKFYDMGTIYSYIKDSDIYKKINENDLIIENLSIGYKNDPVNNVMFYKKGKNIFENIKKETVSTLLPDHFLDNRIRFYCKNIDKFKLIKQLFTEFSIEYNN